MNNKFLRFLVVFLQILIIAVELAICIYSIVFVEDISENYFTAAVVRISAILLMTIAYYKTSVSRINPGNLFIIFFLFSITVAELTVLSRFTAITGWSLIPPRALARTIMAAQILAQFCLIGYAVQYQTNEHSTIVRLFFFGIVATAFMVLLVPSSQSASTLWDMRAPQILLTTLAVVALISNMILAFSETTKAGVLRHMATVLLIAGNYITAMFGGLYITLVGSAIFFFGGIITMLITLRNSVIL